MLGEGDEDAWEGPGGGTDMWELHVQETGLCWSQCCDQDPKEHGPCLA